jgi:hypothetical protein
VFGWLVELRLETQVENEKKKRKIVVVRLLFWRTQQYNLTAKLQ